jgi:adenylate kinase
VRGEAIMRLVLLGPPGVGKGTQSTLLIEYLDIPHLSTGEMLRQARADQTPLGKLSEEYISAGKLVPDPLILELVDARLDQEDCRRGYLLDGFPRTLPQAEALDETLKRRSTPLSAVLELDVDTDQLIRRLALRGREDDKPDVIRERMEQYAQRTAPLSDFYRRKALLHNINGTGTPGEVFARIKSVIDRISPK